MTGYPTGRLRLRLNGQAVETDIDQRALLVEVIRELGAKGTRIGCLTGDCGACSVELDGRIAKSCLVLAVSVDGSEIVTVEGNGDTTTAAAREAFKAHRGFQCGYCTSGMVTVAVELLRRNLNPTEAEIRQAISGNLCRCTGYEDIVKAVAGAAAQLQGISVEFQNNSGKGNEYRQGGTDPGDGAFSGRRQEIEKSGDDHDG